MVGQRCSFAVIKVKSMRKKVTRVVHGRVLEFVPLCSRLICQALRNRKSAHAPIHAVCRKLSTTVLIFHSLHKMFSSRDYNCSSKVLVVFIWSIFIRAIIDHMTCYNLNWPKIKFWVHYFVFSCALDHILKR